MIHDNPPPAAAAAAVAYTSENNQSPFTVCTSINVAVNTSGNLASSVSMLTHLLIR